MNPTMQARRHGAIPMLLVLALGAAPPLPVLAQDLTAGTKIKGAVYGEDARDLGLTDNEDMQERSASYVELTPYLHLQFGESAALYLRTQLFAAAGDEVVQNENELPVASEQYVALRELWLEFGGPTSFPGEVIRLGRQRIKEQDGLWWDRDVESLRWVFDTTLVQAQIGVAEQFGTWRSDDVELSPSQQDRAYVFATMSRQWQPGHYYGLRAAYAQDHADLPGVGDEIDADTKTKKRDYLWVALRSENGFYDPRNARGATYWFEAMALAGRRESANTADPDPADPSAPPPTTVADISEQDVSAMAGDVGLRLRLPLVFPFNMGVMASFAQGERAGDVSHVFEQTGLESNRSRFTGTRTLMHRFNEALAADFSNLLAGSAFISMPYEHADFSLVYSQFRRHEGDVAFTADGVDVQPVTASRDIGTGIDFVATRFFRDFGSQAAGEDEDQRSNVRLRASRFEPGAAYGGQVKDQYKVALEVTLWF